MLSEMEERRLRSHLISARNAAVVWEHEAKTTKLELYAVVQALTALLKAPTDNPRGEWRRAYDNARGVLAGLEPFETLKPPYDPLGGPWIP